jgi:hypothetical protein
MVSDGQDTGKIKISYKTLIGKPKGKRPFHISKYGRKMIQWIFIEIGLLDV